VRVRLFCWVRPGVLTAVVSLGVLGVPAVPAVAAGAGARGTGEAHGNVGEPHSPRLMRELAGPRDGVSLAVPGMQSAVIPAVVPSGPPGAVQGVDVAAFQHPVSAKYPGGAPISWSRVAGAGIGFAAIKATEGNYYVNPYYAGDLAGASAAGLRVVGYAFANPAAGNGTAAGQARYLVRHAGAAGGRTPPLMLDIEYNPYKGGECYGLTPAAMVTWLSDFDAETRALTGRLPVLYTTWDWWDKCTGASTAFSASLMWVAAYTTAASPALPAGWGNWALWQYTSAGTVPGIATSGSTDLDALNLIAPGSQQATVGQAVSVAVSQVVAGSGSGLGYAASGLPSGLSVDSGGLVSGTPAVSDAAQASAVTATAGGAVLGSAGVTWEVSGPLSLTPPAVQRTVAGSPVDLAVPAAAVPAGQTASFTAAGLPPGLASSTSGQITGWAARPGTYHVTLTATDSLQDTGEASFSWTVTAAPGGGPAGPVRSGVRGQCLNDPGDSAGAGTRVGALACDSHAAQRWTVARDGTLRIRGRCLSVTGSATAGSVADLAACSGLARQHWAVRTGAELANDAAGLCLTAPRPGRAAAARIWACTGSASQEWTLPAGPVVSQVPGGCLDDTGDSSASHTRIEIWPCDGRAAQNWTAMPARTVQIHGKCLQASQAATASTRPVELDTCNASPAQRWTITAAGSGTVLRNPSSGLCLTDPATPGGTFAGHPAAATGPCAVSIPDSWQVR
jgi:GH25 family lysozyme M1 (1,4-beta-N-acetylmuramidase)